MLRALFALLLVSSTLGAQSSGGTVFQAMGGLSSAKLTNGDETTDALYGMSFGVALDWRLSNRFALRPEMHVIEKGGTQRIGSTRAGIDLRAVDFPVLAVMHFGGSGRMRPVIGAGPVASYLLSCTTGVNASGTIFAGDCTGAANRLDFGLILDTGVELTSGSVDWGVHARYQYGLADLSKAAGNVNSRTFQILVAFRQ